MSKKKNKNRGVYQNPYQVDDQYLERIMKGVNLSIEDDDPYDYVIDPNHPKAQGASNAPATRSNLKSNASYKDFVNASKEKPVYKPKTISGRYRKRRSKRRGDSKRSRKLYDARSFDGSL